MSTYDKDILSAEDYAKIEAAQKAWQTANAKGDVEGKASASARAEAIRSKYGYSGGDDGQQYITLEGYEGAEGMQKASTDLNAAYQSVADAQKANAEASKAEIDKQREAAMKEAYIGNMMDQKNIDQKLKASGITGGLSESARAAMQNNYRTGRNSINAAAIDAKKDVDLNLQQSLAETELGRAGAKNSSEISNASFQNTAANNNRNIKLNEKQLELSQQQTDLSKYMTFMQNGWVDDTNAEQIASALGVSSETVKKASKAVNDGNYQSMALSLMSAGIYDDSFVNLFNGRFSAETLKSFANSNIQKTSSKTLSFDQLDAVIKEVAAYKDAGDAVGAYSYLEMIGNRGYINEVEAASIYNAYFPEEE